MKQKRNNYEDENMNDSYSSYIKKGKRINKGNKPKIKKMRDK